jgi:hypothetical protein
LTKLQKVEREAEVTFPDEIITARFLCGAHLKRRITLTDRGTGNVVTGTLQSFDSSSAQVCMWVHANREPGTMFYSSDNSYFRIGIDDELFLHATGT